MKIPIYHVRSVLNGHKVLFNIKNLRICGIRDVYIKYYNIGGFCGIKLLELNNNDHNGIWKNFSGNSSLITLFPDLTTITLKDSYHPLDIQWINKHKFNIIVPNTLNTYTLEKTINDINRIIKVKELPKIKYEIDFSEDF